MNSPDSFEHRLARTPFREAPSSLREQVLRGLEAAPTAPRARTNSIRSWVASWFWPHPVAWGTLGLAWIAIGLLSIAGTDGPENVSAPRLQRRVSPAWTAMLREQRALLTRLLQDPPAATLPSEPAPGAQLWRNESETQLV